MQILVLTLAALAARVGDCAEANAAAEVVPALAAAIRLHHYDAAEGARIAAALESDRLPEDLGATALAQALTARLRELSGDRHFRVSHGMESELPAPSGSDAGADSGIVRAELRADGVGYLALDHFPPDSASLRAAYDSALARLAPAQALLIDVRDNHGGDPASVSVLLGYLFRRPSFVSMRFVSRGEVVGESRVQADRPGLHFDEAVPMVVLTSAHTFSGGEALAYELQMYRRACVVGDVSGGAANPTLLLELPADFAVTVPWQRPLHSISGGNWEGRGVRPDVPVPAAAALQRGIELLHGWRGSKPDCAGNKAHG